MLKLFEDQKLSALNIIFISNSTSIFETFLPRYLEVYQNNVNQESNEPYYPIHIATREGMIGILKYTYDYFAKNPPCPAEFDVNSIEQENGENCGLMACRYGNFELLKLLYESCNVNLHILNKFSENAVIIC